MVEHYKPDLLHDWWSHRLQRLTQKSMHQRTNLSPGNSIKACAADQHMVVNAAVALLPLV